MDFKRNESMFYAGDIHEPKTYLKYSVMDGVMSLNSTWVDPDLKGKGLAGEITEAAIAYAKEEGLKIKPVCSYSVRYFENNPEYKDMLAE